MTEVKQGFECGVTIANHSDVKQGDIIEAFVNEKVAPQISRKLKMPTIGVLTLELRIDDSHSLKDKRQIVKALKDRLRHKFNVAVAEIDYQDLWQRALDRGCNCLIRASSRAKALLLQNVEQEAATFAGRMLVSTNVEWME